jgi:hypothetical protein
MNKKIYLISQTESHLTQRGKRHPNLADYLVDNKYNLTYISSNFYHADKRHFGKAEIKIAQNQVKYNLRIIKSIGYYKNVGFKRILSNLIFSWKTYKFLKNENLDNATIIVPSRPVEILFFLSKLKKIKSAKIIVDIRDVWPDAFNIGNPIFKKLFYAYCNFFLIKSVKNFDEFIHTCPSFTDWLYRYAPSKKSILTPLGYDKSRFENFFISEPRIFSGVINFVYIGLLQKQMDILPFISTISKNCSFSLTIYGDDGEGENYKLTKNYIKDNKIENVYLKGKILQNKVPKILSSFDVGLMPMNAKHAFPNKVFDYIALSLPIFSIGNHDTSTFVTENNIGWSCDFDESDINQKIQQTLNKKNYNSCALNILNIRANYSREQLFKIIQTKL